MQSFCRRAIYISSHLYSMQRSVLQCVAVCCSVLQCVAVCCSVLQSVAECCSGVQYTLVLMQYFSYVYVNCFSCIFVCCVSYAFYVGLTNMEFSCTVCVTSHVYFYIISHMYVVSHVYLYAVSHTYFV